MVASGTCRHSLETCQAAAAEAAAEEAAAAEAAAEEVVGLHVRRGDKLLGVDGYHVRARV